ncbi:MAG: TonB-dependent receptor, partial [Saprospiraceae bacterium]|nr:TonB-dependent receptor [Saprospiraceae bacterium]
FQKTFRQIPPTTTQNRSFSDQEDHINRYAISYLLNKGNWQFKSNMSLLDEENIFNDSLNLIHSNNQFVSIINKTNLEYNWRSDVDFHIGFMINNTTVNSKFYQEKITGTNLSTFFKFIHRTRNGFLSLAVNKAWDSHSDSPLTPQLNYIIDLSNENKIAFKVSHEYRLPTFNERFWTPGGDQELESEKGWNQEISFSSESDRYTFETVLFHRTINNWILWAIPENQFFYSATNLAKVQSYGIESKINLNWEFGQSKHILQSGYSYNISKNLENVSNPNIKKGDQIFYTPKHKLILNYHMKYRSWQFDWQSSFVSSTIGILDQLPSYFIADLSIQKSIAIDDIQTRFQLSVNNIFNKNYRIIERRPMPGINYEFKIAFQL